MTSITMHLREIGLSKYEAAAYETLLRTGTVTASDVAEAAEIPKSRVYDVLDTLETKGFVVVQPGRPKKFGPVSPDVATEQFQKYRERQHEAELDEIADLSESLIEEVGEVQGDEARHEAIDISWSYPNRHHILEQLEQLTAAAESEILMITTPKSFERILNHHGEALTARSTAGVDVRAIVADDRPVNEAVLEVATEIMDLRIAENIEGRLYIYDGENILWAFKSPTGNGYAGITTTSAHLYTTLSHLFELLWSDGCPVQV